MRRLEEITVRSGNEKETINEEEEEKEEEMDMKIWRTWMCDKASSLLKAMLVLTAVPSMFPRRHRSARWLTNLPNTKIRFFRIALLSCGRREYSERSDSKSASNYTGTHYRVAGEPDNLPARLSENIFLNTCLIFCKTRPL